jgi:coenzyme F420-reducing hydrogenase delta subunit
LRAKQKIKQAKIILKEIGIEPERVEMFNLGASDAGLFAKACDEMTERARKLGPNPLKGKKVSSAISR